MAALGRLGHSDVRLGVNAIGSRLTSLFIVHSWGPSQGPLGGEMLIVAQVLTPESLTCPRWPRRKVGLRWAVVVG